MAEARFTLITGPRDAGKTATLRRLSEEMRRAGTSVGGVIAEAHLRDGVKVAYSFCDIATGERCLYAEAREDGSPGYRFRDDGLSFGQASIRRAIARSVEALFVDEMGPLEMDGRGLFEPVREASRAQSVRRMFLTVRPSLLAECMARLGISEQEARIITLVKDGAPQG